MIPGCPWTILKHRIYSCRNTLYATRTHLTISHSIDFPSLKASCIIDVKTEHVSFSSIYIYVYIYKGTYLWIDMYCWRVCCNVQLHVYIYMCILYNIHCAVCCMLVRAHNWLAFLCDFEYLCDEMLAFLIPGWAYIMYTYISYIYIYPCLYKIYIPIYIYIYNFV